MRARPMASHPVPIALGSMHRPSVQRLKASYLVLAPKLAELVGHFYDELFRIHPEVRPMFRRDLARTREEFAAALALLGRNIDRLDILEETLMDLGAAHAAYGVRPSHYPLVRDVLVATLREFAGPAWSTELERDWADAVNRVSATMLKGAARAAMDAAHDLETRPG